MGRKEREPMIKKSAQLFILVVFVMALSGCGTVKGAIQGAKQDCQGALHGIKKVCQGAIQVTKKVCQVPKQGAKKSWQAVQEADNWVQKNLW